jgi:D-glycero-alpha-D-manno-heptose-7-phosphate kinase
VLRHQALRHETGSGVAGVIITRSPLRISLGGGATDLPSYYRGHTGFVIAAAIDQYVYITVNQTFGDELILKYSNVERATSIDQIQHPLVREAMRLTRTAASRLEITSMADIPAGTGLGSSGSFTTALLKALHQHQKRHVHPRELAEQACHITIDVLREPSGKQDEYIASYGGLTCFRFLPNDQVEAWPLKIEQATLHDLEDSLLLFFTGFSRRAVDILNVQDSRSAKKDPEMIENLHMVKDLGCQSKDALEHGDLGRFAELMNVHWEHKKQRAANMSNSRIDALYELGRRNGAVGGKLIGAGGGGFLLFFAEDKARLRTAMREAGLAEVRYRFDFEGTKVIVSS